MAILGTVVGIMMAIVTMFAIVCNSLVFIVICWNQSIRKPLNLFLLNLALADIGIACTCIPYAIGQIAFRNQDLNTTFCMVNSFIAILFVGATAMIVVVLGMYQYLMIAGPLDSSVTAIQSCVFLLFAWIIAIGLAIGPMFGWGKYEFSSSIFGCTFSRNIEKIEILVYNGSLMATLYIIPIICLGVLDILILIHIKDSEVRTAKGWAVASVAIDDNSFETGELRSKSALAFEYLAFVIFRTPFFVSLLLSTFKLVGSRWLAMADQIAFWAVYFHAASDPFVYALQHGEYARTLSIIAKTIKEGLTECCCCCCIDSVEEGEKPGPSKPKLERIEEEE